jgi:uncharacterized protein YndB with AHSA1/START domain
MKPVSLTYSGVVAAPIEDVFGLLSDPTRFPEWLPYCAAVRPTNRPNGKGERHRILFQNGDHKVTVDLEIIEFNPPTGYGWVELRHRAGSKTFFLLQFRGGTTHLTMKYVWTPRSLRSWLLGQFYRRRNAHRIFDRLLQNLRKALMR